MPVFAFALSQSDCKDLLRIAIMFLSLHLFIYPASNGFNSFYDKDEKSIGGLKDPPKVSNELLFVSLFFDLCGILLALAVSIYFALGLFIYGLISKAYSHPLIRLKKYPIGGLLSVGIFQGGFVYLLCIQSFDRVPLNEIFEMTYLFPALIATILLIGSYPMTQIYQHEEDKERGDITLSLVLGINGTFVFTALSFLLSDILFAIYFYQKQDLNSFYILQIFLLPVFIYFNWWMLKSRKNSEAVNYDRTMFLNKISSIAMILFFSFLILLKY